MKTYLTRATAPANLFVTLACGLWGGTMMLALFSVGAVRDLPGFLVAATVGATLVGFVTARLFGLPGRRGWALALLGGALATGLGAGIGGGLIFGPAWAGVAGLLIPVTILERPLATALWLACVAALHAATIRARRRWP